MIVTGYFQNVDKEIIKVELQNTSVAGVNKEIKLSFEEPFITELQSDDTIFSPIKKTNATLKVVDKTYLENLLPNKAKDCSLRVENTKTGELIFDGYVTPKVYDATYVNEYEEYEINATDKISILQYEKYKTKKDKEFDVVSFKDILKQIVDYTGLDGYFFPDTYTFSGTTLTPNDLYVSERNWAYEDVEENVTLQEVLEEFCKYFGMSALQMGNTLYLVDFGRLSSNDTLTGNMYYANLDYAQGASMSLGNPFVLSDKGKDIKRPENGISFLSIYNKITVKSNQYAIENFIPNPFDEELLTNRIDKDNINEFVGVTPEGTYASYPYGTSWFQQAYRQEPTSDTDFQWWVRLYDNKYWKSNYFDGTPTETELKDEYVIKNYGGGTLLELGTNRVTYKDEKTWQEKISSDTDWKKMLCINEKHKDDVDNTYKSVFKLDNYKSSCLIDSKNSFLVINFDMLVTRYGKSSYINPDWSQDEIKAGSDYRGTMTYRTPLLPMKVKIGTKWWTGSAWSETESIFFVNMVWPENIKSLWNQTFSINNNVPYNLQTGAKGYMIPLDGTDVTEPISIDFLCPPPFQYGINPNKFWNYNSYCWLSNLDINVVQRGQGALVDDENDYIFENVIDDENVSEMGEITLKLSTFFKGAKPSYSHMITKKDNKYIFLTEVNGKKPEELLIDKNYTQYSTQTQVITLGLKDEISPFTKIKGAQVKDKAKSFVIKTNRVDYKWCSQEITMEEIK